MAPKAPTPTAAKKGGRGELIDAIGGFSKGNLRKAKTVDKSKPVLNAEYED
jgi:hypothetical protein